jgi:hypothetical protein
MNLAISIARVGIAEKVSETLERVSEKSRISPLAPKSGGTGIESPPDLGDLGGVWVVDRTFQTPSDSNDQSNRSRDGKSRTAIVFLV